MGYENEGIWQGFWISHWWDRQSGELVRGFQADVHEVSLPLLLMELSETLRREEQYLDLTWVPREKNQWADDLTNQKFDRFCMSRRLVLDGGRFDWIVLDSLLKSAAGFHAELVDAKRSAPALRCPKSRKKQRTKW